MRVCACATRMLGLALGPAVTQSPQPGPVASGGTSARRKSGKDKNAIDKVFKNLDENGDSHVDFKEYVIFVAALTRCCHQYFEQKAAK
ncbi:PREDICTED: protein S100-P-like [Leptosomus discolor]|uniref:protein S100-P-like n=1 Tax=Leptosomus discolor TaxID=188344 RepID=UPI0005223C29|nr:PREDICTED: protein S100-P-like [Leptosomus discolor]